MDLRFRDRSSAFEEIEIAAFVGLLHVLGEDRAVASFVFPCRGLPSALALVHLGIRNLEIQLPLLHVDTGNGRLRVSLSDLSAADLELQRYEA